VTGLRARGVEVYIHDREQIDLIVMMRTIKRMGIDRLMVEGGGTMNFELIRLGLVDEISAYVAPMLFGGANAPTLADGLGLPRDAAVSLQLKNVEQLEDGGVVLRYIV